MKQQEIIDAVRAGRAEFAWVELLEDVEVTADAVRIDGVRVTVTADTAQRCADLLGASLTTPKLEDEIYARARVRIPAFPRPGGPDGSWSQTVEHSRQIDDAIARAGGKPGELVATVGKSWVLVNALPQHPGKAANYGWHDERAPYAAVTGGTRVWQPVGLAHNTQHHDYSQTLRLCRAHGRELPSHEPLAIKRQPGVVQERDTSPSMPAFRDRDTERPNDEKDTEPEMPGAKAYAIDVSHHQTPAAVPWLKVAETSSLCIVRTSYGTMRDRQTAEHVKRARGAGLAVGLYHFFRPSQPWQAQLDVFRAQAYAADFGAGDVCPALDVEADPLPQMTAVSPAWQDGVRAMLAAFREDFGDALVYITQREFSMLGRPEWLLTYPLWTAHYTAAPHPATPAGKACVLWQHRVGPYDPSAPGGYFAGGSPQLDQNRILGRLPLAQRAPSDAEQIEDHGDEADDRELHELSVRAIAQQFPLDVDWNELERERRDLVREPEGDPPPAA